MSKYGDHRWGTHGSRQFYELPQTVEWHALRDHIVELPGASLTDFVTDGVTEAWLDFTYRDYSFTINDQFGDYWFFVDKPECPDEVLEAVVEHCRPLQISGAGEGLPASKLPLLRWGGLIAAALVLIGLGLSVRAIRDLAFTSSAADAATFAKLAWMPFLLAAGVLLVSRRSRTAVVVAAMAPLNLLTVTREDGSGLILQLVACFVAVCVALAWEVKPASGARPRSR